MQLYTCTTDMHQIQILGKAELYCSLLRRESPKHKSGIFSPHSPVTPGFEFSSVFFQLCDSGQGKSLKLHFFIHKLGESNRTHATVFGMRLNKNDHRYEDCAWHIIDIKYWYLSLLLCFHFYYLMSFLSNHLLLESALPPLMIIKNWSMLKIRGYFFMARCV